MRHIAFKCPCKHFSRFFSVIRIRLVICCELQCIFFVLARRDFSAGFSIRNLSKFRPQKNQIVRLNQTFLFAIIASALVIACSYYIIFAANDALSKNMTFSRSPIASFRSAGAFSIQTCSPVFELVRIRPVMPEPQSAPILSRM